MRYSDPLLAPSGSGFALQVPQFGFLSHRLPCLTGISNREQLNYFSLKFSKYIWPHTSSLQCLFQQIEAKDPASSRDGNKAGQVWVLSDPLRGRLVASRTKLAP